jgi:hypothetical protein
MCIYQVITTTSMHCSYPHCTALSLLPFLLTGLSSSFHVPQTAHGSRTTTLNARTPTRELHARSLACLPKKPLSFQAPSYPRSPPQLGQGKANQSCPAALLHRDRNGTSPARARTKRTQASTAKQAGNLAINPTHAAKRGKQGKSLLVPISTPAYALHVCVCVCVCACAYCTAAAVRRPYILYCLAARWLSEPPRAPVPSVGCLHMHYEFKADGRAGGSSPTHLSETTIVRVLVRLVIDL